MPRIPGFPERPYYNSIETYLLELAKDIAEMVVDPIKMGRFREQLKIYAPFWKEWKTAEEADLKRCWKPEMGRPEYVFNVFSLSYNLFKDPQKEAKRLAGSYALCAFIHDSQLPHLEKINDNIISKEAVEETLSAPGNMNEGGRNDSMYVIEIFFNYVKVDLQEFCKSKENKSKLNAIEQEIQQANKLSDIEFLELAAAKFEEESKKILSKNETWHDLDRSLKGWFESAIGRLEKLGYKDKVGLLKYFYQNLLHFAEGIDIRSFRGFPDSSIVTSAIKYANELSEKIKEASIVNKNDKPQKGTYKAQQELAIEEADKLVADAALNPDKDIYLLYVYVDKALYYAVDFAKMTRGQDSLSVEQFVAKQVRLFEYVKRIETYPNIIKLLERWPSNPGITFAWLSGQNALEVSIEFAQMISTGVIIARNERSCHGVTSHDNLNIYHSNFKDWQTRTVAELLAHEIPKPDIWPSMADIHREYGSLCYKLRDEYNRATKNQKSIEDKASSAPQETPKIVGDTFTIWGMTINWRAGWNKLKNLPLYLRAIVIILLLIAAVAFIFRKQLLNVVASNPVNRNSTVSNSSGDSSPAIITSGPNSPVIVNYESTSVSHKDKPVDVAIAPLEPSDFRLRFTVSNYEFTNKHLEKTPKTLHCSAKIGGLDLEFDLVRVDTLDKSTRGTRSGVKPRILYNGANFTFANLNQFPNIESLFNKELRFMLPYELRFLGDSSESMYQIELFIKNLSFMSGYQSFDNGTVTIEIRRPKL